MKFVFIMLAMSCSAVEMPAGFADRVANAIYWAEGGQKARKPYGVLSIPVKSVSHARQITINSIHNNWRRWEQAGSPGDFLDFMNRRWAPLHLHPKNRNWANNVRKRL